MELKFYWVLAYACYNYLIIYYFGFADSMTLNKLFIASVCPGASFNLEYKSSFSYFDIKPSL